MNDSGRAGILDAVSATKAEDNLFFPATALAFLAFAGAAVLTPLAVYTLSLAAFGLPHVLSELRYVDLRFGRRLERSLIVMILMLLSAMTMIRTATVFHIIPQKVGVTCELIGAAALALLCVRGGRTRQGVAITTGLGLGIGAVTAPFLTAILLSISHNLTPLGFLWQLAPRGRRLSVVALAAVPFFLLPLFVVTGIPRRAMNAVFSQTIVSDPLAAGPLADHLLVYVPPPLLNSAHAIDIFTASVVAQGAHYAAVILLLPWLVHRWDPKAAGLARWPKARWFAVGCIIAGAIAFARFEHGFSDARSLYGIAAAFHAWLEIPILILALTSQSSEEREPNQQRCEIAS